MSEAELVQQEWEEGEKRLEHRLHAAGRDAKFHESWSERRLDGARGRSSSLAVSYETAYTLLKETIDAFDRLCKGEFDHLPEQAFFLIGGLEDLEQKAESLGVKLDESSGDGAPTSKDEEDEEGGEEDEDEEGEDKDNGDKDE